MAGKHYYWIVTTDETDRPYLLPGGETEDEAREKGLELLGGIDFEVRRLKTRNQQTASSMVRGKRLEDTHSLKRATRRVGHKRSVSKLVERFRRRNK